MTLPLPRYVIAKPLANGTTGFYFTVPTRYRQMGCAIPNEPLGMTTRSRAASTAKAAVPPRSMDCSTNGGKSRTASLSKASPDMGRSIGCFGNTRQQTLREACFRAHPTGLRTADAFGLRLADQARRSCRPASD